MKEIVFFVEFLIKHLQTAGFVRCGWQHKADIRWMKCSGGIWQYRYFIIFSWQCVVVCQSIKTKSNLTPPSIYPWQKKSLLYIPVRTPSSLFQSPHLCTHFAATFSITKSNNQCVCREIISMNFFSFSPNVIYTERIILDKLFLSCRCQSSYSTSFNLRSFQVFIYRDSMNTKVFIATQNKF